MKQRGAARLAAAVSLLALVGSALYSPAVADAADTGTARTTAVLDGSARFEVLTPTLIRMEYAGDNRFQDTETFNAVNRAFPAVPFTTSVAGGYRVIDTGSVTLRYKEGGGPFTAANTSISVSGGTTTAAPSFPSYCVFGTACEAEDGLLSWGAMAAYDHGNHTGSGFVAGFTQVHSEVQQDVSAVPSGGTYQLSVRYANAQGGDGQSITRTLSTTVNGAPGPTLSMPVTGSWDTWSTVSVPVTLNAGVNTIGIVQNAADSANVNLDSLAVTAAGADPSSATGVQLWTCNQTDAQRWSTPGDQTIRVFGKCLDVTFGGTANGTPVQLYDCNGSGSQTWVTQTNGSLLNPQSGRCLDDPNNNEKAGDLLQIYDCDNTTAQQFALGG